MTRARLALMPVLVIALAATACDSSKPKPAAPAATPADTAPTGKVFTPLSQAKLDQCKAEFDKAAKIAAEAEKWKREGDALVASDGMAAAIPKYQEAMPLYMEAMQSVEHWVEPEFGQVTEDQVEQQLQAYVNELHRWQKARASMGKVPPKE